MSVCPVPFIERGSQLAHKRLRRFTGEKRSIRADDHAFFTASQHHVRPTLIPEEPWSVRANNGDYDVVVFVS